MRFVPLLLVALLLAACGSTAERTGVAASSGQESESGVAASSGQGTVPVGPSEPELPGASLKPPPILLVSEHGIQNAVRGSYCISYIDEASGQGQGECADMAGPSYPRSVTSVAGGDRVTFVLAEATFGPDSVVTIRPLGCAEKAIGEIALGRGSGEQEWRVDLQHGAYQLDVFARFAAADGRTGDVNGTLGLTVAGPKKWDALGVSGVTRSMRVCPFAD